MMGEQKPGASQTAPPAAELPEDWVEQVLGAEREVVASAALAEHPRPLAEVARVVRRLSARPTPPAATQATSR